MASFALKFLRPYHTTCNSKIFSLHYIAEILHARVSHTLLIISAKVFPYDLKLNHNTSITDGRTDKGHKRKHKSRNQREGVNPFMPSRIVVLSRGLLLVDSRKTFRGHILWVLGAQTQPPRHGGRPRWGCFYIIGLLKNLSPNGF